MAGDEQPNGPQGFTIPNSVSGKPIMAAWSTPLEPATMPQSADGRAGNTNDSQRPTISNAVASIKTDDFSNVINTPCARNGFMTGIITGAATGGLKLVVRGNWTKAANWAVGAFVLGSAASYEYCQYLRRAEKRNMKRAVEIHAESQRQQAERLAEKREQARKLEEERKAAEKRWYKFW